MALAALHVVGALLATIAFSMLVIWIAACEQERVKKRRRQDASIALGVPVAALDTEELVPRMLQYSAQRFSTDLLRNRLSDLCGLLKTGWGWLGGLAELGAFVGTCWAMYTEGAQAAVAMWLILAIGVYFWLMSVAFSYACLLFTGRYPGEAKQGRSAIALFIEERGAPSSFGAVGADAT